MSTLQNAMGKMTNYRWTICAMLFFATTINYLDRQVLSLTWDEFIKPEFHWNESHYGIITAGWEQRKVTFGPSVYGRPVPAFTLSVEL